MHEIGQMFVELNKKGAMVSEE